MLSIEEICIEKGHAGEDVRNSNGVSIFFPWSEWDENDVVARYDKMIFIEKTNWKSFLLEYRKLACEFEKNKSTFS